MRKSERRMLFIFLLPIILFYIVIFAYPTINTFYMTFFEIPGIGSTASQWTFVGFENYKEILKSSLFQVSVKNITIIMIVGGIATFAIAMLFASILNKGMRGKKVWKAIIYFPNIITPVALVVMWTQYAFNNKYGLLKNIFDFLGLEKLASIPWTSPEYSFYAMLIAYTFGGIGYYMVIFMAALEKIPRDLEESASIEGASQFHIFFKIKLPLMKEIIKTAVIFWCLSSINFFLWSRVFSVNPLDPTTLSPANYMYGLIFGNSTGNVLISKPNVGLGAVVGVLLCVSVVVMFYLINLLFGKEKYEY